MKRYFYSNRQFKALKKVREKLKKGQYHEEMRRKHNEQRLKEYDEAVAAFRAWNNGLITQLALSVLKDGIHLLPILFDAFDDSGVKWPEWIQPAVDKARKAKSVQGDLCHMIRDLTRKDGEYPIITLALEAQIHEERVRQWEAKERRRRNIDT